MSISTWFCEVVCLVLLECNDCVKFGGSMILRYLNGGCSLLFHDARNRVTKQFGSARGSCLLFSLGDPKCYESQGE